MNKSHDDKPLNDDTAMQDDTQDEEMDIQDY